jgi:hypothetical protein
MTERLYYTDSYLRHFTARIVDRSADGLVATSIARLSIQPPEASRSISCRSAACRSSKS